MNKQQAWNQGWPVSKTEPDELHLERCHLEKLLIQRRQNLRILKEQAASYGMDVPLPLINKIAFEQKEIREVTDKLEMIIKLQKLEEKLVELEGQD